MKGSAKVELTDMTALFGYERCMSIRNSKLLASGLVY